MGEFDDEDQKPSVEYLDSLNDYRKRSRSREDDGAAGKKLPKLDDHFGNGDSRSATEDDMEPEPILAGGLGNDPEDDPIVYGPFISFCLTNP
jgi:transcription initiation factor TFIIE subunit alpha